MSACPRAIYTLVINSSKAALDNCYQPLATLPLWTEGVAHVGQLRNCLTPLGSFVGTICVNASLFEQMHIYEDGCHNRNCQYTAYMYNTV